MSTPAHSQSVIRGVRAIAALIAIWPVAASSAPSYPERPVRLLLGFAPGGTADAIARILSPRLHDALGRPWVVDNRSGAAGNIATEIVAKANPDGHTLLLFLSTSLTVSPTLYKLRVDVQKDLQPVIMICAAQYMLVVHQSIKAGTVRELIDFAKAQPGKLTYASAGIGSPHHLAAELFKTRAGISMTHVPYKGGGPASAAILGNEVQVLFGSLASLQPHVATGRIKALGVTGLTRSQTVPDVPTIAESGLPGFDVTSWLGFMAPARTPGSIINTIYAATAKILQAPDVRDTLRRDGLEVAIKNPQQLGAAIKAETEVWAKVIRDANITVE